MTQRIDEKETVFPPLDKDAELDRIAETLKGAQGMGFQVLNLVGAQAEGLLDMLPRGARDRLEKTTASALDYALTAAQASRGRVPDASDWLTRAVTLGTGAAGGFGGMGTALAELPVTTTVILRAILGIAAEHGFDPDHPDVRAACIRTFAAAGPLDDKGDEADLSFLTMRLTVTGGTLQGLIAKVAPRLAIPLGQKVAAQMVPIIGAAAGAAINYTFTAYYQDMARVQFGLMRVSEATGESLESLTHQLKARMT